MAIVLRWEDASTFSREQQHEALLVAECHLPLMWGDTAEDGRSYMF